MDALSASQINKENYHTSTNKELQRLKVQLNDRIFDINKLQQDYAQQKAKHSMEFQKERLSLNRIIKELKEKNQQDNDQWSKKIQEYRSINQDETNRIRQEYEQIISEQRKRIDHQFCHKYQLQITALKKQLEENTNSFKIMLIRLQREKQQTINSLKITHYQQINKKEQQHKQIMDASKRQFDNKTNVLQNLYINQQQQKLALVKKHQYYVHDSIKTIIEREKQIQGIKSTVIVLQNQINQLNMEIESLKNIEIKNKQRNDEKIKELSLTKMKDIKKMMEQFQIKYDLQRVYFQQEISKIKDQTKQMNKIYKQKQKKWDQRGQIILKTIQINSKMPDSFKTIKNMELQIIKKDTLLKRQRQNLKNCQLNLQNMQQIYDKMFVSNNYLYKSRSKSYKIKKNKLANQTNQSNNSTFVEQRIYTEGDK